MWSDDTAMMAVKNRTDDSRTLWSVRSSEMVVLYKYRDRDVLNLGKNRQLAGTYKSSSKRDSERKGPTHNFHLLSASSTVITP